MKLGSLDEFGLRCIITIAREGEGASLTIPMIAKKEGISQSHVAKVLSALKKGGFVTSHRGQIGGYALSRPPQQILVSELLDAVGGRIFRDDFCERFAGLAPECVHKPSCCLTALWSKIQVAVDEAVKGMTLSDLMVMTPVHPVRRSTNQIGRVIETIGNA